MANKREVIGVPMGETRVVRLFWLGERISPEAFRILTQASHLDPRHVDIINVADLGEGGLYNYMVEGLGLPSQDINKAAIDALTDHVIFLRSAAFKGIAQNLQILPPLRYLGEYKEPGWLGGTRRLRSAAAQGDMGGKPRRKPSDGAMSGRVAMVALGVLFLLAALMIWIAGR